MMRLSPLMIIVVMILITIGLLPPATPTVQAAPLAARQPGLPPSLFGLNMYITGRERSEAEAAQLVRLAGPIGARWTREEICWACWGREIKNDFYDRRIAMLAEAGIGIIGMLLTTPEEYRDPACVAHARRVNEPEYWCAPTDMDAFARWVGQVVERYDGDGSQDAPGSPRIAAWEIWNEPDMDGTWLPRADPVAYAEMLRKASAAIRAADPTALVLIGGVYVFDAVGEKGFLDRVVDLAGWDSFDVLSIHPWLIDHAPDNPALINPRERFDVTIPGRLELAKRWVAARGGGKPIWITEVGWSTCGSACAPQFAKNGEEQANYMVRTFVLAAAAGIEHVSYFQLSDKFKGGQQPWGPAAILNDDLSPKPAYQAYGTMVSQLQFARYQGTGSLHRQGVLVNHRFTLPDGVVVDVLWTISGQRTIDFPLATGLSATLVERDGQLRELGGGTARLTISERPVYVRQVTGGSRSFAETGQSIRGSFLRTWERGGGLAIYGLPITPERLERGSDGVERVVQWFERTRFESHPQHRSPNDVLIGLVGVEYLARQGLDWRSLPTVDGAPAGCRYFPETRHSLCPPFRAYWERNGGLATFGFPISEPANETVENGRTLSVQYFERARFEDHPDLSSANRVQLSRLGVRLAP
ncbi:cellulase family glycosylhydrolase [Candidatus Chloroploca sp. M-50]|uniref:Cellulase family glycosylhydrolase n=1 Tax=Candidatus Chloroploca mongolica TaxID=2528176 RepID=A0ABS4DEQ1_9CHLR|nr:cellulase family glycosylhydrolase [Candidatus Chloroploca mongolica]MBP1467930.1 cellulase family glycosylhydrolase [Candidatus Chloroploca mongolica]